MKKICSSVFSSCNAINHLQHSLLDFVITKRLFCVQLVCGISLYLGVGGISMTDL